MDAAPPCCSETLLGLYIITQNAHWRPPLLPVPGIKKDQLIICGLVAKDGEERVLEADREPPRHARFLLAFKKP